MSRRCYNKDALKEDSFEDLLIFGYSCKLFRDDEKALEIDRGKHLIPWMGDETLLIDRYDGRGHLDDVKTFVSDLEFDGMTEEEKRREEELDKERYNDLYCDIEEKLLYEEEEMKRLKEAEIRYGAVPFMYQEENAGDGQSAQEDETDEGGDDSDPFVPSENISYPSGMELPKTIKQHQVIEKTALFISKQNLQMEILIKTRQKDNPAFNFLNFDDILHPYYKHMLNEMKQGRYSAVVKEEATTAERKQEEHIEIHISSQDFLKSVEEKLPPGQIKNTSYDILLNNLRKHIPVKPPQPPPPVPLPPPPPLLSSSSPPPPLPADVKPDPSVTIEKPAVLNHAANKSVEPPKPSIVPPPPDKKFLIDKMANYVARNGPDFELVVKKKNDPRFDFIAEGHIWNNYYKMRKSVIEQEMKSHHEAPRMPVKSKPPDLKVGNKENRKELKSISFSIKSKETSEKLIRSNILHYEDTADCSPGNSQDGVDEESMDICYQQDITEYLPTPVIDNDSTTTLPIVSPQTEVTKKPSPPPKPSSLENKTSSNTPGCRPKLKPPEYGPACKPPSYGPHLPSTAMERVQSVASFGNVESQEISSKQMPTEKFSIPIGSRPGSNDVRTSRLRSLDKKRSRSRSHKLRRSRSRSHKSKKSKSHKSKGSPPYRSHRSKRSCSRSHRSKKSRSRSKSPLPTKRHRSRSPKAKSPNIRKISEFEKRSSRLRSRSRDPSRKRKRSKLNKKPKKHHSHHHKHAKKNRDASPVVLDLTKDDVVDLTQD